ncbi:unnamed protein product, partial [Allacma fusca]
ETGDIESSNVNNGGSGSLIDANGNIHIRGSDGTLTISEAYPEQK